MRLAYDRLLMPPLDCLGPDRPTVCAKTHVTGDRRAASFRCGMSRTQPRGGEAARDVPAAILDLLPWQAGANRSFVESSPGTPAWLKR